MRMPQTGDRARGLRCLIGKNERSRGTEKWLRRQRVEVGLEGGLESLEQIVQHK